MEIEISTTVTLWEQLYEKYFVNHTFKYWRLVHVLGFDVTPV